MVDNGWAGLAKVGAALPVARLDRHGVERIADVPYRVSGLSEHLLDVYRPAERTDPLPVVLYVHGGGFRILSKDSHWMMGLAFAKAGYLVFNASYRLAPAHPYPAAVEDTCAAWQWARQNAEAYGGDPERMVVAGESAGANLATGLAVATSYERPEPFARRAFDAGQPRAVVAACGMLQVSDPGRFARRRRLAAWVQDRIDEVADAYLESATPHPRGRLELADPLLLLERGGQPARAIPPVFTFAGTRDPVLDDTRRLAGALDRLEVPHRMRIYPGEIHAFHAMIWRRQAREAWRETFEFLEEQLT